MRQDILCKWFTFRLQNIVQSIIINDKIIMTIKQKYLIKNPLGELGIKTIKIVNKIQQCDDQSRCGGITGYDARGEDFLLDVLAFYVPIDDEDIGNFLNQILLQILLVTV